MPVLSFRTLLPFTVGLTLVLPTAASGATEFSLADVLARVAEANPTLHAQRLQEDVAEARRQQASLRPDPVLEFTVENALGTGALQGVRQVEATLLASQTIERGGKRARRMDLADRTRDAAAKAREVLLADLSAQAVSAYVSVIFAEQRVSLAEDAVRVAREMLDAVGRLHAGGVAPAAGIARARVALATAEVDARRADAERAQALGLLASTWGGRREEIASVAGTLRIPPNAPTEAELLSGLQAHPRIAWQESMIEREEAVLALSTSETASDLTAAAGVRYFREGSDAGLVAGLSMPLPNRTRNQSTLRAARAALAATEQQLRATEVELRTELARACHEAAAARLAITLLGDEALPAAEEALAEVNRAHAEGFLPLVDVLETQRTLLSLRRDLLDAQASFATALARIEAAGDPTYTRTRAMLSLP